MYLFACFYASLQPLVVPVLGFGLFCMLYAQKFQIYRLCKRPTPGNNEINTALYHFIFAGPLLFAVGNILFTDLLDTDPNNFHMLGR